MFTLPPNQPNTINANVKTLNFRLGRFRWNSNQSISQILKQFWADRNYIAWSPLAILLTADKQKFIQVFIYTSCLIGNCTLNPLTDLERWAHSVHSRVWKKHTVCTHSVIQVTTRVNPISWYYPSQSNLIPWNLSNGNVVKFCGETLSNWAKLSVN